MRSKVLQNRMLIGRLVQPPANAGILSASSLLNFFFSLCLTETLTQSGPFRGEPYF